MFLDKSSQDLLWYQKKKRKILRWKYKWLNAHKSVICLKSMLNDTILFLLDLTMKRLTIIWGYKSNVSFFRIAK